MSVHILGRFLEKHNIWYALCTKHQHLATACCDWLHPVQAQICFMSPVNVSSSLILFTLFLVDTQILKQSKPVELKPLYVST